MSEYRFEASIVLGDAAPADVVRERVYGRVRVAAEWAAELAAPEIFVTLVVHGDIERRDAPAYAELFFHDVFLLLNLAAPGSFGGTISIRGGALRASDLEFDPRVFVHRSPVTRLPLADVVRWYDDLNLGAQQLATTDVAAALVQLLHLGRGREREEESILRLAIAASRLGVDVPGRLFELRDDIARGRAAAIHPMHDDALDPRVEDATREWIEVADAAARVVIAALQDRIRAAGV